MKKLVVVGLQWGDEGKGKVVDLLAERADFVVRGQGGSNAGHTIVREEGEFKLHLIPSGILYQECLCLIGSGCVLDPEILLEEIKGLKSSGIDVSGRLMISPYAHLLFSYHKTLDKLLEKQKGKSAIGTTGRGIGPCYKDKVARVGVRVGDILDASKHKALAIRIAAEKNRAFTSLGEQELLDPDVLINLFAKSAEDLKPFVVDVEEKLFEATQSGKHILFEGANGSYLDVGMGTYPYVTSSHTLSGGVVLGAGVGPTAIDGVLGITKSYTTRVGSGPFITELTDEHLWDCVEAREIGTTTGRERRMGWLDLVMLRRSVQWNGVTHLAMTKLDILDTLEEIKVCIAYRIQGKEFSNYPHPGISLDDVEPVYQTFKGWKSSTKDLRNYEELPKEAKEYVSFVAKSCGVPLSLLSVGPARSETMILQPLLGD